PRRLTPLTFFLFPFNNICLRRRTVYDRNHLSAKARRLNPSTLGIVRRLKAFSPRSDVPSSRNHCQQGDFRKPTPLASSCHRQGKSL
ncbi:hypothetical protein LINPERPRIM_LOCUS32895, partial [Linum perenne]